MSIGNIGSIASYSYYNNKNTQKTNMNNTKTENDLGTQLTEEEISLAKEFKDYLEYSSSLNEQAERGYLTEEDKVEIAKSKTNPNRFRNVIETMGVNFINPYELPTQMGEEPSFDIPQGNVSINREDNSINLARGGRININGGYIYIADGHISTFPNNMVFGGDLTEETCYNDFAGKGYIPAIKGLINAVEKGNSRFSEEGSEKILSLLSNEMGIDTSKDIKINGVTFEVVDGCLQTKGYVEPEKEKVLGRDYLQNILERAYEQNLL